MATSWEDAFALSRNLVLLVEVLVLGYYTLYRTVIGLAG